MAVRPPRVRSQPLDPRARKRIVLHSSGRDGAIAATKADEHRGLVRASNQPEHRAGAVDRRVGQRHPAPSLIWPGDRDVGIDDVEHRIAWNQRRGVSVGAQAQVDEIQNRRRPSNSCERPRVSDRGAVQV